MGIGSLKYIQVISRLQNSLLDDFHEVQTLEMMVKTNKYLSSFRFFKDLAFYSTKFSFQSHVWLPTQQRSSPVQHHPTDARPTIPSRNSQAISQFILKNHGLVPNHAGQEKQHFYSNLGISLLIVQGAN